MDDKFVSQARVQRKKIDPPEESKFLSLKNDFFSKRKFVNSMIACAIIALGVFGLNAIDTQFTNDVTDGLRDALNSEMINDEDLGKLRLVDADYETEATQASADEVIIPLEGEILSTFATTGKEVVIKSTEREVVRAVFEGKIVKTTSDSMVVENENGTQTTYEGVLPAMKAGDNVIKGTTLGQLQSDTLTLTTVGSTGYTDSLQEEIS